MNRVTPGCLVSFDSGDWDAAVWDIVISNEDYMGLSGYRNRAPLTTLGLVIGVLCHKDRTLPTVAHVWFPTHQLMGYVWEHMLRVDCGTA